MTGSGLDGGQIDNQGQGQEKITGLSTYTSKQHHGISADILARKRGIGLDKEKRTLQSTTQDNVISDLKTLILRYIIDFLS